MAIVNADVDTIKLKKFKKTESSAWGFSGPDCIDVEIPGRGTVTVLADGSVEVYLKNGDETSFNLFKHAKKLLAKEEEANNTAVSF